MAGKSCIEHLRAQCLLKGLSGIKGLAVLFRNLDKDYSKSISMSEFKQGLSKYGVHIADEQLTDLFSYLDKDGSGNIDFREFLTELRPPMAKMRVEVINQAFDKLDGIKDGVLKLEDLKQTYKIHAKKHPKFISGEWTLDQVLRHFLDTYDTPGYEDGMVTRDEFLNYYAGVSCTVDDDAYFDLMMRSCWGLPAKGTKN